MKILEAIKHGFKDVFRHKMIILLVFVINMIFGIVAIGPIKSILTSSLASTTYPEQLNQHFDFTIWTDVLRENMDSLQISEGLLSTLFLIYLLWSIFYVGGFVGLVKHTEREGSSHIFWSSGAKYFFKFLRLTIYLFIFIGLSALFLFWLMGLGEMHILEMESEMTLIANAKISLVILVIVFFLIGIFKDIVKLSIAHTDLMWITKNILASIKSTFSLLSIGLGALLSLVILVVFSLCYWVTGVLGWNPVLISLAVVPQLLVLFRIVFRYVRLAAFEWVRRMNNILT